MERLILLFQQDLDPVHTSSATKSCVNDHKITVFVPDLNPPENRRAVLGGRWEVVRPNNADNPKSADKEH